MAKVSLNEDGSFPSSIPIESAPYATLIPGRTPLFKVHNGLGQARQSMNREQRAAIYVQMDGKWVLKEMRQPPSCATCGKMAYRYHRCEVN